MEKLDGKSMDIVAENISKMKELFPEVFCEDKIDFERLQEVLGEYTEDKEERYSFNWKGKSKAIRIAQTPSTGTLRPAKEESKNFDTTENLYIEGDNLEVLKLLQKTYHNRVKMIYIDPPYNTGKDFVYPDDFRDNIKNYLEITGQVDEEGKKTGTNSETSGRYHTDWLNMMYPRLKLAKNLLCDDGVIFISIDDNEVHNIRKICDEIFGEGNFIGNFIWRKKSTSTNVANAQVSSQTDYTLTYSKSQIPSLNRRKRSSDDRNYPFSDGEGNYRTTIIEKKDAGGYARDTMKFEILGTRPREGKRWQMGEKKAREYELRNRFILDDGVIKLKIYEFEDEDSFSANPNLLLEQGNSDSASKLVNNFIFGVPELFSNPKPVELIKHLLHMGTDASAIVLDFFSGSATTAHAVMQLNAEDAGNRKFIMVQLPELTDEKSEAYKAGYKNICEIGKERIRRAGEKIKEENKDKEGIESLDIGFKVFKLDSSNIKKWDGNPDNLEINMDNVIDNFVPNRTEEDIVYEIMLKYGIDLTYPVEMREVASKKVFSIGFGALIICLDNKITLEVIDGIVTLKDELKPEITRVVFKDNGFQDDSVKTNAIQILRRNKIQEIMSI